MSLSSDVEEFCTMVSRIVEELEEINSSSKRIPDTEVSQLSQKFAGLMDSLGDVDRQLRSAIDALEDISSRWGR